MIAIAMVELALAVGSIGDEAMCPEPAQQRTGPLRSDGSREEGCLMEHFVRFEGYGSVTLCVNYEGGSCQSPLAYGSAYTLSEAHATETDIWCVIPTGPSGSDSRSCPQADGPRFSDDAGIPSFSQPFLFGQGSSAVGCPGLFHSECFDSYGEGRGASAHSGGHTSIYPLEGDVSVTYDWGTAGSVWWHPYTMNTVVRGIHQVPFESLFARTMFNVTGKRADVCDPPATSATIEFEADLLILSTDRGCRETSFCWGNPYDCSFTALTPPDLAHMGPAGGWSFVVLCGIDCNNGTRSAQTIREAGLIGCPDGMCGTNGVGLVKLGLFANATVTPVDDGWSVSLDETVPLGGTLLGVSTNNIFVRGQGVARGQELSESDLDLDGDGLGCSGDRDQVSLLAADNGTSYVDDAYVVGADFDVDGDIDQDDLAAFQTLYDSLPDCNSNGQPDACDIVEGLSDDVNTNGIPDECEPPLEVLYAASRHNHDALGPFDIEFTSAGAIESRGPGQVVIQFSSPLLTTPTSEDIGLLTGEAQNIALNGDLLTFDLVNVPDQSPYSHAGLTMTLAGLVSSEGLPYQGPPLCVRFLRGSGDQDMYLNWSDVMQVQWLIGQHLFDFRYDVDHDGIVTRADFLFVRSEVQSYPYVIACPCGYAYCGPEE